MQTTGDARLSRIVEEARNREREALRCYRPMHDAQLRVHESPAHELIVRGGKRSGKSTAVVMEFASRVLGVPIARTDGTKVPLKFPVSTKEDRKLFWVIGWDVNHIGQTIYRLLFEPGLFRIIKDDNQWRVFHPEKDKHRMAESVPAGPAIPERMILDIDWEAKSAKYFRTVRLVNGAEIRAYPSSAKAPKQGDPVNGIWIDEDIQNSEHLKEYQDRLTDTDGWFLWSVWPHVENNALVELLDRAEAAVATEDPQIEAVQMVMSANPFISDQAKQHSFARMGDDEEIARRDRGELLMESLMMYDFIKSLHLLRCPDQEWSGDSQEWRGYLMELYRRDGCFPSSWTRYLSIDPSHTRTACCFAVVPPPEVDGVRFGNLILMENELVCKKHTATMLARQVVKVVRGRRYEAFIMDRAMGRKTNVGTDKTIFEVYANAFQEVGLSSDVTRNWFVPGIAVPPIRYRAVRNALETRNDGSVGLLLVEDKTYQTQKEFATYRKKRTDSGGRPVVLDEPANPQAHDCMAALEYMVAYLEGEFSIGRGYVMRTETVTSSGSAAYRASQRNIFGRVPQEDAGYVHLGPGVKV